MSDPERPSCRTCPYWDVDNPHFDMLDGEGKLTYPELWRRALEDGRPIDGQCRRFPRHAAPDDDRHFAVHDWPATTDYDWCGEHPDFPAYLAALKAQGEAHE